MSATEWRDATYERSRAGALATLRARAERDHGFGEEDVRAVLSTLYSVQGQDWDGRGEASAVDLEATIDAHEFFIAELTAMRHTRAGGSRPHTRASARGGEMAIEIRKVTGKKGTRAFVKFQNDLYKGNPFYVPTIQFDELATLDPARNPAFDFCRMDMFMAWRDGKTVGRIAVFFNARANEKWNQKRARFGWMDFVEDPEVARALLDTAESWAKERGFEEIHGPLGFTDLDKEGLLVEGFEEMGTFVTLYNHAYYGEYLEKFGYRKDIDWIEFLVKTPEEIPEKVRRVNEIIAKRSGIRLYEWKSRKEIKERFGHQLFELIDEAYAKLYGTTPLTERQVAYYIDAYLGFIDPRFTKVLVDEEGKLAGFGISMPNLSKALRACGGKLLPFGWAALLKALRKPEVVDMMLVAVKNEYQSRGAVAIIMNALNDSAIKAGVRYAETNPELETNIQVHQVWKDYDKRQHKRRRVYIKSL